MKNERRCPFPDSAISFVDTLHAADENYRVFAWDIWARALLQSTKGTGKAYVYYFDHRGPFAQGAGANHGAEISYVFGNFRSFAAGAIPAPLMSGQTNPDPTGRRNFRLRMTGPSSGDPNGAGLPQWPAFSEKAQNVIYFGDTSVNSRPLPNAEKLKAFDLYYARRRAEVRKRAGNTN